MEISRHGIRRQRSRDTVRTLGHERADVDGGRGAEARQRVGVVAELDDAGVLEVRHGLAGVDARRRDAGRDIALAAAAVVIARRVVGATAAAAAAARAGTAAGTLVCPGCGEGERGEEGEDGDGA